MDQEVYMYMCLYDLERLERLEQEASDLCELNPGIDYNEALYHLLQHN